MFQGTLLAIAIARQAKGPMENIESIEVVAHTELVRWTGDAVASGAANGEGDCMDGVNCDAFELTIAGQPAKPSRDVKVNDLIQARTGHVNRTIKVLGLLERRVGASVAREFAEDLTPAAESGRAASFGGTR